jgi:hypothetical protein
MPVTFDLPFFRLKEGTERKEGTKGSEGGKGKTKRRGQRRRGEGREERGRERKGREEKGDLQVTRHEEEGRFVTEGRLGWRRKENEGRKEGKM